MAKNSIAAYGAQGKTNVLMFDPEDVLLVTDPKHPLFDERVNMPLSEGLVRNIMCYGVLEPIIVRKNPDTGVTEVVVGRQRVKAVREANKRLRERGEEPLSIPATVKRAEDSTLAGILVSENEQREADTPLGRARKMQRLLDMGKTEDDLTIIFGFSKNTIKNTLALLECCADVKKAVDSGAIGVSVAYELSKLDPEEQRKTLDKMLKAGGSTSADGKGKHERSRKMRAAAGKKVGPTKKEIADFRAETKDAKFAGRADVLGVLDWILGNGDRPEW